MQIISTRTIGPRSRQSRDKENTQPENHYRRLPKSTKKRYLQLHSLRANDEESTQNKTISTFKRYSRNVCDSSEYSTYRSKSRMCNLLTVTSVRSVLQCVLAYLEVADCSRLYAACKAFQTQAKKGVLSQTIKDKILNKQIPKREAARFCMHLAGANPELDNRQLTFYASIPCKLATQILQDARNILKDSVHLGLTVEITKAIRIKNPHIVYSKSILLLVHRLLEVFDHRCVFPLIDRFLNHLGAACLYSERASDERLVSITEQILVKHATHMSRQQRVRLASNVLERWLKPFFTENIFPIDDWLTFFQLFLFKGWIVVLELLATMVSIQFPEANIHQNSTKQIPSFLQAYKNSSQSSNKISLEIQAEFNATLYLKKQPPPPPLLRTRFSQNITLIGGKRGSCNRLKSTQALRQNNCDINRSCV